MTIPRILVVAGLLSILFGGQAEVRAQSAAAEETAQIEAKLRQLESAVNGLKERDLREQWIADVDVYRKAAEWILRHNEFYQPRYVQDTLKALDTGLERARDLEDGEPSWGRQPGSVILGYRSKVDGSTQPYALSIPAGVDPRSPDRWPLYVVLHGRGGTRNEVRFIRDHDGKPLPEGQTYFQLDVFGRTDNAYRWSGETDVFEAIADVQRRFRIDERRVTLWGFSMGGAGAWHLGLHYPSRWSSVGPGAGFVDFYKYQKQTEKLPPYQDKTLRIYDAIDYALNAYDVPIVTYGGELDKQLVASTSMVEKAESLGVPIKLIVGPQTGHKFHPESRKEFMAFHAEKSKAGRKMFPGLKQIRFITYTPKYNECEWLTIEELVEMYEPAIVEGHVDEDTGILKLTTQNVAVLQIARDVAPEVVIDGDRHDLSSAADGLLPGVYYQLGGEDWNMLDYDASLAFFKNPDLRKRKNLQGPIDDAFMQPFVCVRGTGTPWSQEQHDWAEWTLERFSREFDKWLRGTVPVIDDADMKDDVIASKNLILFGDPGSNSVLARIVDRLPVHWTRQGIEVGGKTYDPQKHGLSLIFPNPLNPNRYVVINSGHTFHEKDFKASNSWLFPRLGDIAVQAFEKQPDGSYQESIEWAALFDSSWQLPR